MGEGISLNDGDGEKLEYIFDDDEKNMIADLCSCLWAMILRKLAKKDL